MTDVRNPTRLQNVARESPVLSSSYPLRDEATGAREIVERIERGLVDALLAEHP